MNKSDLVNDLRAKNQQWQALLDEIGLTRMAQPGVNGDWAIKDLVAHLNGWNRKLAADLQAAQRGEPQPPPPWSPDLQTEDEINAWIYDTNRGRAAVQVLEETQQVNRQILAMVEGLPADVRIEKVEPSYYLVWVGDTRFRPGELFDHFRDDHEADVRTWLARQEKFAQ